MCFVLGALKDDLSALEAAAVKVLLLQMCGSLHVE